MRPPVYLALPLLVSCATGAPQREAPAESYVSSAELQGFCASQPCRKNTRFTLIQADGSIFEYDSELDPPVVQEAFLTIFPSERIFLEAEEGETGPVNFRQVDRVLDPARTITLDFRQELDSEGKGGMILDINNPFSRPIKYDLGMMLLADETLRKTSSCPVLPGNGVRELWSDTIFQLVFARFRFLDNEDEFFLCIE